MSCLDTYLKEFKPCVNFIFDKRYKKYSICSDRPGTSGWCHFKFRYLSLGLTACRSLMTLFKVIHIIHIKFQIHINV